MLQTARLPVDRLFRAFSDRTRLRILHLLDPAAVDGPDEVRRQAFSMVRDQISARIREFVASELPQEFPQASAR